MTRLTEHLVDTDTGATAAIAQLGPEVVSEEAAAVAAGPLAPVLAHALAQVVGFETGGWQTATASFIEGLTRQQGLLALASSLDELLASPVTVDAQGGHLHNALLRDLTPLIYSNPLLAAGRLEGAVRLAVAGAVPPFGVRRSRPPRRTSGERA